MILSFQFHIRSHRIVTTKKIKSSTGCDSSIPKNPTDLEVECYISDKCIIPSRTFFFLCIILIYQFCLCQHIFIQFTILGIRTRPNGDFSLLLHFKNKLPSHIGSSDSFPLPLLSCLIVQLLASPFPPASKINKYIQVSTTRI